MRVVLLGNQTWGHRSLEALVARPRTTVPLLVTHPHPDDPYEVVWAEPVADLARAAGVEVVSLPADSADVLKSRLAAAGADVVVASNWRSRVPTHVLAAVPMGGINVHDALLPRYGGFAPLNWAIARGETEVGLSAHVMSEAIDLGDMIVQERLPVGPDETVREVAERIFERVGPVTVAALDRMATPGFAPVPQSRARSTMFHRRTVADSRIDWSRPPREVHNLVRAQADPYPNAFTFHGGGRLAVKRTALPDRAYCGTPGRIACRAGGGVIVICGRDPEHDNQGVVVLRVQPEGGREIDAADYFTEMGGDLACRSCRAHEERTS